MIVARQAYLRGDDVPNLGQKILGRIVRDFPHLRKLVLAVLVELADDYGSTNQFYKHQVRPPAAAAKAHTPSEYDDL
jgi:hypothetical protein